MKKFNKDNYRNISKEDIIELAEMALSKITEQIHSGEIPEYDVTLTGDEVFKIHNIEVIKTDTEYFIEVGGACIIRLASELPNLRGEISKYGMKEVSDIASVMYYMMEEIYCKEQLELKMKATIYDLNFVYDSLIK